MGKVLPLKVLQSSLPGSAYKYTLPDFFGQFWIRHSRWTSFPSSFVICYSVVHVKDVLFSYTLILYVVKCRAISEAYILLSWFLVVVKRLRGSMQVSARTHNFVSSTRSRSTCYEFYSFSLLEWVPFRERVRKSNRPIIDPMNWMPVSLFYFYEVISILPQLTLYFAHLG